MIHIHVYLIFLELREENCFNFNDEISPIFKNDVTKVTFNVEDIVLTIGEG